jgi:hypothetical protein
LVLLASVGCDTSTPQHPVTGTVTYQGKPVEGANVQFIPSGEGMPGNGVTDASGKFTLATAGKPGAPAGDYKVTVVKVSGGSGGSGPPSPEDMKKMGTSGMKSQSFLPGVYGSVQSTTLKATVKAGTNDVPLELK